MDNCFYSKNNFYSKNIVSFYAGKKRKKRKKKANV